jgi:glycosyltransferase involved in cell wall biosynthesis
MKIATLAAAPLSINVLLRDQIKMLEEEGHEVIALCGDGPMVQDISNAGIAVETIDLRRELSPLADMRALCQLVQLFKTYRFDVVHTHTPKAGLLGPLAARLAGVSHVVHTIHGLLFHKDMPLLRQKLFWIPEKWTATLTTHLLSQSREDIDVAISTRLCSPDKIEYLGNGIDVDKFDPAKVDGVSVRKEFDIPEDAFVVGCVGRLVLEKGFRELFLAAEELSRQHDCRKIHFVIVGPEEPDQKDAIDRSLIDSLQERGFIRFLGWRNDTRDLYAIMDIFVLPSYREGIPRACMEAAAMEKPIIATDIRGNREVILNNVSGLLVPVRNSSALATAIKSFYIGRDKLAEMGRCGRQHIVGNFNQTAVLHRLSDFYRRLQLNATKCIII